MDMICGARSGKEIASMTDLQVATLLKRIQMSIVAVVAVQVIIFILWMLATAVPGFSLYDGAANSTGPYTHVSWWMLLEFFSILAGSVSTLYGFSIYYSTGVVEKGSCRVLGFQPFYQIALLLSICSHIPHIVLSLFEVSGCTSTLCSKHVWCLAMMIALLFVLIMVEAYGLTRSRVFESTLCNAVKYGKLDTRLNVGGGGGGEVIDDEPTDAAAADETTPLIPPQQQEPIKYNITPMMAKFHGKHHGAKFK